MAVILRPGKTPDGAEVMLVLRHMVRAIRARWPRVDILVRGDSHYSRPEAMSWCERSRVAQVFGLAGNKALLGRVAGLAETAALERVAGGAAKVRRYDALGYAAKSWAVERRVIARIEASGRGADSRFVVTSLPGAPRWLYEEVYCARGQAENLCMDASRPASALFGVPARSGQLLQCIRPHPTIWPWALMRSAIGAPTIKSSSRPFGSLGLRRPRSAGHAIASKITLAARGNGRRLLVRAQRRADRFPPARSRAHASGGRTIGLATAQEGPDDASELVRHGRDHDIERPPTKQVVDPCPGLTVAARRQSDQGSCTVHQLPPETAVTALADAEQPLAAAGRVLAWGQAEPGGEAAAAVE